MISQSIDSDSYFGAFWRNTIGERHGTEQTFAWMQTLTEKILREYKAVMES